MSKGFIRMIVIVSAASLAFGLAGGPGPAAGGSATKGAVVRDRSQVQVQVQTNSQDCTSCAAEERTCTQLQSQAQERTQARESAVVATLSYSDGTVASALRSVLPGKGDVLRDQVRDRLKDRSRQLEDAATTLVYLIAYDHDYEYLYGNDFDHDYNHLDDGPPPEGGYGGHGF